MRARVREREGDRTTRAPVFFVGACRGRSLGTRLQDHSRQLRRLLVGNVLCPCIAAVTYIHNILVSRRYYVLVEVTRKENKYTLMPFV